LPREAGHKHNYLLEKGKSSGSILCPEKLDISLTPLADVGTSVRNVAQYYFFGIFDCCFEKRVLLIS